jgi:hypothetical protein
MIMATVQIFLKSGQVIILQDTEVIKVPGSTGTNFSTPRGTKINFLDQEEIAAVISQEEWA